MLHKNTYLQITEHLAHYGVVCKSFRPNNNGYDGSSSYPSFFISATWGDIDLELKLMSVVHDASANILGIKLKPDLSNRDEKVFFSINVTAQNFIHEYMYKNGFFEDLSFIYSINHKLPMRTDYKIIVEPDILFLMTGHLVYTPTGYVIDSHSERPMVKLLTNIASPPYNYLKREAFVMHLQHDGTTISPDKHPEIKTRADIRLKLFQSLVLHYMNKTRFKIDGLSQDEMLALSYDDLVNVITLQKMVDI